MKLLLVHFHFKIPEKGGALRSWMIARGLAERGFQLEVITTHNDRGYRKDESQGFTVHYLPISYSNSFGTLKRIWAFLRFNNECLKLIPKLTRPDLVYCISTPLTSGIIARKAKKRWNIPYVFEVGDLWPEAPIQMGVIPTPWLRSRLFKLEKDIYNDAQAIIALSDPIRDSIGKKTPDRKVIYMPNMSDRNYFSPDLVENEIMPEFNFLIGAIGAIGKANHLDHMIEAAQFFLYERPDVGFIIMGEGSEEIRLRRMASDLPNLKFIPFSKRPLVRSVLQQLHMAYISYKTLPILETGCPNKVFDALAAGKPVITNFKGWIPDLLEKNECGFSYEPDKPGELLELLVPYLSGSEEWKSASVNAHNLASEFDREKLLDHLADELTATQVTL